MPFLFLLVCFSAVDRLVCVRDLEILLFFKWVLVGLDHLQDGGHC
jgi:hypothetical protein